MSNTIELITKCGIIPVISIDSRKDALPLAQALSRGGIKCAEITLRTDCALDAIADIAEKHGDFLLGAGTVLSPEQADAAADAGASFIVSPGFNPKVVGHCIDRNYTVIPGICTPSEAELAMSYGLEYVKFFPAQAAGGIAMIKAMSAPYGNLKFMPTGGITLQNVGEYLGCKSVFACGGSWIAPTGLIAEKNFDEIEKRAAQAVQILSEIRK